jgi:hypothetical protein
LLPSLTPPHTSHHTHRQPYVITTALPAEPKKDPRSKQEGLCIPTEVH